MKKYDFYIVAVILALIIVSFGARAWYQGALGSGGLTAVIYKDGEVYQTVSLAEGVAEEIKVTGGRGHYNLIEIDEGKVRIREADCPNKLCVSAGWLDRPGQIAVCAPHRLKVAVEGSVAEVDTTAY